MKHLLIIIIVFSTLYSCNTKDSKKTQHELNPKIESKVETTVVSPPSKDIDTIQTYYPINLDTIHDVFDVNIENDIHLLKIKSYSLNDSAIVNVNMNYKETYHNYVSQITLTKQTDTILLAEINKHIFKDSLDSEFYRRCTFDGIRYDGIRSNQLYFSGNFSVPDTDWVFENDFFIFYRTKDKGKITSLNYKDIGL